MRFISVFVVLLTISIAFAASAFTGSWATTGTYRTTLFEQGSLTYDETEDFGTGVLLVRNNRTWSTELAAGKVRGQWRPDGTLYRVDTRKVARALSYQLGMRITPRSSGGRMRYAGPGQIDVTLTLNFKATLNNQVGYLAFSYDLAGSQF